MWVWVCCLIANMMNFNELLQQESYVTSGQRGWLCSLKLQWRFVELFFLLTHFSVKKKSGNKILIRQ